VCHVHLGNVTYLQTLLRFLSKLTITVIAQNNPVPRAKEPQDKTVPEVEQIRSFLKTTALIMIELLT